MHDASVKTGVMIAREQVDTTRRIAKNPCRRSIRSDDDQTVDGCPPPAIMDTMHRDTRFKIPQSVLVVIYTPTLDVLLLRRCDGPGTVEFWQSVTGSLDSPDEGLDHTARREVFEETAIDCRPGTSLAHHLQDWKTSHVYEIYPQWRYRYAPGVFHNTEHVFGLQVPTGTPVRLNPDEHTDYQWLLCRQAADLCFSSSNAAACRSLLHRAAFCPSSHE